MVKEYKHLTPDEVAFFLEHGYLIVHNAFSREKAASFTRDLWVRLGMDPNDPSTWPTDRERVHMPVHTTERVETFAPRVWEIMKELLGGEERIDAAASAWGDSFIVNFGPPPFSSSSSPSTPTPPLDPKTLDNWHIDGDFFVHFLDSPEQALLVIPVFSDILPGGGATYIAPDSIPHVARYLAHHPQGVLPLPPRHLTPTDYAPPPPPPPSPASPTSPDPLIWSHAAQVQACTHFVELTARTGDVVLLHPLMMHSASPNTRSPRVPRIITNPPVALTAPFRFSRTRADSGVNTETGAEDDAYSLVELATLRALGADAGAGGLEWERTGERRAIVPARVAAQERMRAEEGARLAEARARAQVRRDGVGVGVQVQAQAPGREGGGGGQGVLGDTSASASATSRVAIDIARPIVVG